MKNDKAQPRVSNREFITMIRSALDEAGHPDIMIARQWIVEDETGYSIHVPVGAALSVPLRPRSDFHDKPSFEDLKRNARDFALALVNLKRAKKMLEKYARDVRVAAVAEITAAQAEGLDLLIDGVGFKSTRAYHLTDKNWKEAAHHILASVRIRHTSCHLQPEVSSFPVEEPADVAKELAGVIQEQRERQDWMAQLEALGADLIVDQITLDLLAACGLNAEEMLRNVWKAQWVTVKFGDHGGQTWLSLVSSEGNVTARGDLGDCFWSGRSLEIAGDALGTDADRLVGMSLGDRVKHPVFTSRPIVSVERRLGTHSVSFDLSDKLMFDAETGRIWRNERLAA
ncbi:MAG: hypothetical protein KGJ57_21195 [Sphingomonadales bacterium]|nr:hypothetical protein [Sphingomonadales bacterium]MDE2171913.1 hypothetical protein [Sphingomonadales bacterium]